MIKSEKQNSREDKWKKNWRSDENISFRPDKDAVSKQSEIMVSDP